MEVLVDGSMAVEDLEGADIRLVDLEVSVVAHLEVEEVVVGGRLELLYQ